MEKKTLTLKEFKDLWINSIKRNEDSFIFGVYSGMIISIIIIIILTLLKTFK